MEKKQTQTILIAVGITALLVGGYFLLKDTFTNEDDTNTTEENEDESSSSTNNEDELVDMDVSTNGGKWSSDIPSSIPEFDEGKIQSTSFGETGTAKVWTIIFENVDENDLDKYKSALENKGFENVSTYTVDNNSVIMTAKEPYTVLVTYNGEEETIGVTITEVLK